MRPQQYFSFSTGVFGILVFGKIELFSGSTDVCDSCYTERYIVDLQLRNFAWKNGRFSNRRAPQLLLLLPTLNLLFSQFSEAGKLDLSIPG